LPIAWLPRDARFVEKLATPDVTIADMIGDLDPIKAARASLQLSDELTMHYGLLPRAHRGIFAINELPDLAGKIQGRSLQHPSGRGCSNQRISGTTAARCAARLQCQP
jgi:Mg-chelatase subunit ChlI